MITDMRMPCMGGAEFVQVLKARHPEVIVIGMTGDQTKKLRAAAKKSGVAAYLIKPFKLDALYTMLAFLEKSL